MDISHVLVGILTAVAIAWLVWAETGSRRNSAAQMKSLAETASPEINPPPRKPRKRLVSRSRLNGT